jgi:hypothetical protein
MQKPPTGGKQSSTAAYRSQAAPGFAEADLPDTANPNWDEEIRTYWAETP